MTFGNYFPSSRGRSLLDESRMNRSTMSAMPTIGRLFNDAFSDFFEALPVSQDLESFTPRINVSDSGHEIRVVAELPGMEEKDIEVTFARDGMIIRGEKREEHREGAQKGYYECSYGRFERFIPLRSEIKENDIKATFDRGILTITLPKTDDARARTRKVPIQTSASSKKSIEVEHSERAQSHNGKSNAARSTQGESPAPR